MCTILLTNNKTAIHVTLNHRDPALGRKMSEKMDTAGKGKLRGFQ